MRISDYVKARNLVGGSMIANELAGIGVQPHLSKASNPLFGDVIEIGDVSSVVGSPTLSVTTGPNGKRALKIVTGVGVNTEISFPGFVGALHSGEMDIALSGGYAEGVNVIGFYSTPDAGYGSNFALGVYYPYNAPVNASAEQGGSYTIHLGKSTLSYTGSITFPFAINAHKLRITPRSGMSATVYIYGIGFNPQPTAGRIVVTCDDGYDSWFKLGQPLFDAAGIPITCGIIPANVDAGTASGYAYMRQLKALINRGGAVVAHGPNGSSGVGSLLSAFPGDTASQLADMVAVRSWIQANKLTTPGYEKCYVWPQGQFQTALGDTALLDAALAAGFTTGRNANGISTGLYENFDSLTKYQHMCLPIIGHTWSGSTANEVTNISAITTAINNTAAQGADCVLMFHRVQPTSTADGSMNSIGIRVSDLTTIRDAIVTKMNAGTLKPYTLPQLASSGAVSFWQGL